MSSSRKITNEEEALRFNFKARQSIIDARLADKKLQAFTKYTYPQYQVNWHHRVKCDALTKLVFGELDRLIILEPPRNGKSELVSRRLPAFALGVDPDDQIIATSYGDELASKNNREIQRIIDSEKYRKLFPSTTLSGSYSESPQSGTWLRNAKEFEIVGKRGYYKSSGIGGAITGRGGKLLIIDDPTKNREEADSATHREMLWDWYTSTFYTRKEGRARILITVTRWHEDDLVGRLLKRAEEDPNADQWTVISFPAIRGDEENEFDPRKKGEPLWPEKYSLQELLTMKSNMGSRDWSALMQQTPIVEGGNIVKREWWKYYKTRPAKFDEIIQSWDMSFDKTKNSSYVVGTVWGRVGASKYLLDLVREQMGFTATVQSLKNISNKWPTAVRKLVEKKANGAAVIDSLKSKVPGLIAIEPKSSKESRAHAVSPEIEAGNVYLPESAPWLHDYLNEWSQFPNSTDNDQVDSTTQALLYFRNSGVGTWTEDMNDDDQESDKVGEY